MSIGSYFVSEEAEKAANWDALEEFRKLKRHRDSLTDAMSRLGKSLGDFASVLQNRQGCTFDARVNEIVVGREQRTVARVDPTQIEWETVSKSIKRLRRNNRTNC